MFQLEFLSIIMSIQINNSYMVNNQMCFFCFFNMYFILTYRV